MLEVLGNVETKMGFESTARVFEDYVIKASAFRKAVLKDPNHYIHLETYHEFEKQKQILPLMFLYSVDDDLSASTNPVNLSKDDLWSMHTFPNASKDGKDLYSYRLLPAPPREGAATLDRTLWIPFIKACGALALVQEVDWLHPISSFWLRTSGEPLGVTFRRR
jgi:hypothetical protein